jgi:hypothetical protein
MNSPILFSEKQHFKQWWLWLILLAVNGFILFGIVWQVVLGNTFGDKPIGNTELLILGGVIVAITLLMLLSKLETKISIDGIAVRFFPLHFKFRHFSWDELANAYVRQYSPLGEYGGWGLRYSISGHGKAYNVSGKQGLQLEFTNGKKLLIGTKKADELRDVLNTLKVTKP